jgi:hypothetical protein
MAAYCDVSDNRNKKQGFEGYVTAGFPLNYRIHPVFLEGTGDISLKVRKVKLSL